MARAYPEQPLIGVGGLVWRDQQILLVQRRHPPKAGEWSIPGGTLELGETAAAGVAREVLEETGCTVRVGAVVAVINLITPDAAGRVQYHYVLIDFLAEWQAGEAQPNEESTAVAWSTLAELPQYGLWSETEEVIRRSARLRVGELP